MSEESTKKATKKHRKSEREEKGFKMKKGRKSGPGTAEDGHGLCEGHQRFDPCIAKVELMKDSTLPRRVEDQLCSRTPSDTPSNTLRKVKVSGKRKRTDRDAMRDESVNFETDTTEPEPQRNKRRDENRAEDRMVSDIEIWWKDSKSQGCSIVFLTQIPPSMSHSRSNLAGVGDNYA